MRGNFIAQAACLCAGLRARLHLAINQSQLRLQQIDLFLLPENRPIKFVKQILGEAQLDFEFGDSIIHGAVFRLQVQRYYKVEYSKANRL